jgi:hypothetical protein
MQNGGYHKATSGYLPLKRKVFLMQKDYKKCAKCGTEKPLAQFKRRLSRAQMHARGMKGAVLMTISSKNCKDCQPKRKPPRKQTPKQLHNMVVSGDIKEARMVEILAERQRMALLIQSRARYEAWVDQWRKELKETLAPMGYEIHKVRAQIRYAEEVNNDEYLKLLEKYLSVLTREKSRILLDYEADPHKYKRIKKDWWDLVSEFGLESLRDRWMSIRKEDKASMKVPELLARRK